MKINERPKNNPIANSKLSVVYMETEWWRRGSRF